MPETPQHTIAITVAYHGRPFCGFARQPELLTVQGELEHALETIFRRPIETTCAGRTDAGVHARGQIVSFDLTADEFEGLDFRRFKRSLNAITHEAIAIRDIEPKPLGFSARFDAKAREYRYFLVTGETPPIFMRDYSWYVPGASGGLNVEAMQRASQCLIGEQDFKSFCRASSAVGKPTCRNLMEVSFSTEELFGEELIVIKVIGSSFLHSMVRSIVGSLVEIGQGRRPEGWLEQALAARDRKAAGECAPACGLVFWKVYYE